MENRTNYDYDQMIGIAQRRNNPKRQYVLVNRFQGKHCPVEGARALALFQQLGKLVNETYYGKKIAFIGFAETATAIGAAVAAAFCGDSVYFTTTRESLEKEELLVSFREEHSHAVQQLLYGAEKSLLSRYDGIIFVEDEITTGNTIWNFITALEKNELVNKNAFFGVASILNSMTDQQKKRFSEKRVQFLYLIQTEGNQEPIYFHQPEGTYADTVPSTIKFRYEEVDGRLEPRLGIAPKDYERACKSLAAAVEEGLHIQPEEKILILGTEECMYPALYTAAWLERSCPKASIFTHATTRSPIVPRIGEDYPITNGVALDSVYEAGRQTYLYNLGQYHRAAVLTDALQLNLKGVGELAAALRQFGCPKVTVFHWRNL